MLSAISLFEKAIAKLVHAPRTTHHVLHNKKRHPKNRRGVQETDGSFRQESTKQRTGLGPVELPVLPASCGRPPEGGKGVNHSESIPDW